MEQLPVKIEPDNLKDTLVEYHFQSDIPVEALAGLVYQELKEDFKIVPRASRAWQIDPQNLFKVDTHDGLLLTDDCIKIHLKSESILFNTVGKYPRWTQFSSCIYKVIEELFQAGFLKSIQRVGMRYISEYPEMSIFGVMKGSPSVLIPGGDRQNSTYRTEVNFEGCEVVLSIADKVPAKTNTSAELTYFSLIDIIVAKLFHSKPITAIENLKAETNQVHRVEKQFFFGILTDEYIASLNPEYQ
ncbi:MAG: TIGR04255 family protein [Saprospiraceae bacterium]